MQQDSSILNIRNELHALRNDIFQLKTAVRTISETQQSHGSKVDAILRALSCISNRISSDLKLPSHHDVFDPKLMPPPRQVEWRRQPPSKEAAMKLQEDLNRVKDAELQRKQGLKKQQLGENGGNKDEKQKQMGEAREQHRIQQEEIRRQEEEEERRLLEEQKRKEEETAQRAKEEEEKRLLEEKKKREEEDEKRRQEEEKKRKLAEVRQKTKGIMNTLFETKPATNAPLFQETTSNSKLTSTLTLFDDDASPMSTVFTEKESSSIQQVGSKIPTKNGPLFGGSTDHLFGSGGLELFEQQNTVNYTNESSLQASDSKGASTELNNPEKLFSSEGFFD